MLVRNQTIEVPEHMKTTTTTLLRDIDQKDQRLVDEMLLVWLAGTFPRTQRTDILSFVDYVIRSAKPEKYDPIYLMGQRYGLVCRNRAIPSRASDEFDVVTPRPRATVEPIPAIIEGKFEVVPDTLTKESLLAAERPVGAEEASQSPQEAPGEAIQGEGTPVLDDVEMASEGGQGAP